MKKIMIMASAIMMAATLNAEPQSIEPFDKINVEVPARVRVVQGNQYSIQVVSADKKSHDVVYSVENGVLKISTNNSNKLNESPRNTVITIITPADDAIVTTGSEMAKMPIKRNNK